MPSSASHDPPHGRGGLCAAEVGQQQGELVTALPGQHRPAREHPGGFLGHPQQHPVAGLVTGGVVDLLEVVQVQQGDRQGAAGVDPLLQQVVEAASVAAGR